MVNYIKKRKLKLEISSTTKIFLNTDYHYDQVISYTSDRGCFVYININ